MNTLRAFSARAQVAQLVEQWTENPRVGGSIPPLATIQFKKLSLLNGSPFPNIFEFS